MNGANVGDGVMEILRKFLSSRLGKIAAILTFCLALVCIWLAVKGSLGMSDAAIDSRSRIFICSETGRSFEKTMDVALTLTVLASYSGKNTGSPQCICS